MERKTDELNTRMLELSFEAEKDLKIIEVMLKEKALCVPGLKMKWIQIFYEEERYLKRLKESKEFLIENYMNKMAKAGKPQIIMQRDAQHDTEVVVLTKEISEQKDIVRFVEDINGIWRNFGFDIKSCVDITKMENF